MFSLFNDGDYAKVRQSIFLLCGTVILICTYELEIRFPPSLFDSNIDSNSMKARTVIPALWVAIAYLLLRYIATQRALYLRFSGGLGRETDVEQKAKHYSAQIDKLLVVLDSLQIKDRKSAVSMSDELSAFLEAHKLKEVALSDFFQTMGDVSLREKLQQKSMEEANKPYSDAIACLQQQASSAENLKRLVTKVGKVTEQYRELAQLPELAHYNNQYNAEVRSGQWDGLDRFWISSIGIILIVLFALYQSLSLYELT